MQTSDSFHAHPQRTVSLPHRALAKGIDCVVAFGLFLVLRPYSSFLGALVAIGLLATGDGWGGGQSLGKRMMGLEVRDAGLGTPCNFQASLIRNLPFLILFCSVLLAAVFLPSLLLGIAAVGLELYFLVTLGSGKRWGDIMGHTVVREFQEF